MTLFSKKQLTGIDIEAVRVAGLCTGCGTCVGICPVDAIVMHRNRKKGVNEPAVDRDLCTGCGLCYNVCAGHEADYEKLNQDIFNKEPKNDLIGNYINCYSGFSCNDEIRISSSSGALATEFLLFALENDIIDGALLTRLSTTNPLEPESYIAKSHEEILQASGSKYCPTAPNTMIKEIIRSERDCRLAVVNLPCQISSLRKAMAVSDRLRKRIVLCISIFCAKQINFKGTEFLFKRLKIDKSQVVQLSYRSRGWPGGMTVKLRDGTERFLPLAQYYDYRFGLFIPYRCTLCNDQTGELADISFGDAWLKEFADDRKGTSAIISRNKMAEEILLQMAEQGIVQINKLSPEKVYQSQQMFRYKKIELSKRMRFVSIFGKAIPSYNQKYCQPEGLSFSEFLKQSRAYIWMFISRTRFLKVLLSLRMVVVKIRKVF